MFFPPLTCKGSVNGNTSREQSNTGEEENKDDAKESELKWARSSEIPLEVSFTEGGRSKPAVISPSYMLTSMEDCCLTLHESLSRERKVGRREARVYSRWEMCCY